MLRTLAGRWLIVAVAALNLAIQVAVASHNPALHEEESGSKCRDTSEHFCPEFVPDDADRCLLCQAGLGGIASIVITHSETFKVAEPVAVSGRADPQSFLKFISAAPRAPPAL